jgi:hypothetical protein
MADIQSRPSLSNISTKQKVVGALTIIIMIFVIYEVVGLFSTGSTSTPEPVAAPVATAKPMSAASPTAAPVSTAAVPNMATAAQPVQTNVTPTILPVNPMGARKDSEILKDQDEQQKAYLDSLNQLQLLKLKREIAETNQAIAAARLATETANKGMSDLLTQPAQGAALNSFVNNKGADGEPLPKVPVIAPEVPFVVISVSMQFERWNAVLESKGKFYTVSIGDTLLDGSTVASINRQGVVLVKEGKRRRLGLTTTIPSS